MTLEDAKKLVLLVARKQEAESRFLYPHPQSFVYCEDILDFVRDEAGLASEIIDGWLVEFYDELDAAKKAKT